MAVPPAVVTERLTEPADPAGATAVICVALLTVKELAATEPKLTLVAPVRFVPVMTTLVPPAVEPLFGEIALIVGAAALTEKLCWTRGAAEKLESPAWSALTEQVPAPVKLTTPPEMAQMAELLLSIVKATARPEVAVAVGV